MKKNLFKKNVHKKRRKLNKKGISPLIATVLLIGFTVALAALVMTWGSGFIKKITTETSESTDLALKCANLDFKITNVDCSSKSVTVTNDGATSIKAIKFRLWSGADAEIYDYNETVIGGFESKTVNLNAIDFSSLDKLEAIPIIAGVSGGEDKACDNFIEEYLNPCS